MDIGATLAIAVLAAAFATAVSTPMTVPVLRRFEVVDDPNHRSSHRRSIVRGAGVAMVAPVSAISLGLGGMRTAPLVIGATALAAIGFADDVRPRPALVRFLAQAVVAAGFGFWVSEARGAILGLVATGFTLGYVNSTNFMDGINGITGLHAVVAGATFAMLGLAESSTALAVAGGALAGVALGFLPVNFPRATAFPGDVGSYMVGGWIAGLVALGLRLELGLLTVGGVAVIYVVDTGTVVIRRALRGETVTEAHREHVYQRLVDAGHSHTAVALAVAVFVALGAAIGATVEPILAVPLLLALAAAYLSLPVVSTHIATAPAGPRST